MFFYGCSFLVGNLSLLLLVNRHQASLVLLLSLLCFLLVHQKVWLKWFLCGVIWACCNLLFWGYHSSRLITEPKVAQVEGVICSIPQRRYSSWNFDFCVSNINGQKPLALQRSRFSFSWGRYAAQPDVELKAGQIWWFNAKLKPIHGRVNPAGFDYEKWLISEGYAGTGRIKQPIATANQLSGISNLFGIYQAWRQSLFDHFKQLLPESPVKGIALALLMGERAAISQEQWLVFQDSGTSHLLAISGLHVGIAALWCYWLSNFLWRRSKTLCQWLPSQRVAEVVSLLGAVMIMLMSGAGLPSQRAVIMLILLIMSRRTGRYFKLHNLLGLALIAVLLWQPFAVLSTSFWLSFGAVTVIALASHRQLQQTNRLIDWLKINGYLYIALMPLGWLFFNKISWVALSANIFLIPLMSFFITPMLYLGALISFVFSQLTSLLWLIASQLLSLGYLWQELLAGYNSHWLPAQATHISLLVLCLGIGFVLAPKGLFAKGFWFLPLIFLFLPAKEIKKPPLLLWVFDAGQSLAVYLETPEGNLLYDTAWGNEQGATANSILIPFFKQKNIHHLDKLIISHADADHAGGLAVVSKAMTIGELLSGEKLEGNTQLSQSNLDKSCHDFPSWQWGRLRFKFLQHLSIAKTGNNSSCVLSISDHKNRLLLTGDIEKGAEERLLANGLNSHQVLIAPHHGSETSSTQKFVKAVAPNQVIFSTGYDNQWQFPRQKVVKRYQDLGSQIKITHRDGAIKVTLDEQGELKVESLRHKIRYFWR